MTRFTNRTPAREVLAAQFGEVGGDSAHVSVFRQFPCASGDEFPKERNLVVMRPLFARPRDERVAPLRRARHDDGVRRQSPALRSAELDSFWFHLSESAARRPNHALQRTRPSRRGFIRTSSWAGSLSLGR